MGNTWIVELECWFWKHAAPSHTVASAVDDPLSALRLASVSISLPLQAKAQFPLFQCNDLLYTSQRKNNRTKWPSKPQETNQVYQIEWQD